MTSKMKNKDILYFKIGQTDWLADWLAGWYFLLLRQVL